ncbi:hypothetical protein PTSG_02485 [Salpingoeca rosetta]|uniref:TMC domain-containing protein n=1 Tax=Salpingoeca rosetta (strain ATCC 50818 / BSB-021) TaxID=946362 RepID=F2U2C0_SALR5|nr:uncharacterized protein PTSG_02485 [Salpingoeca rosetta]EGD81772.1 hypothetical protein PTSG_02485 [Salpingoeca rosetta]|eukprot:XP_004996976.1 hypothetical protein PTSG_02485 [Salpingoeca rosetta]
MNGANTTTRHNHSFSVEDVDLVMDASRAGQEREARQSPPSMNGVEVHGLMDEHSDTEELLAGVTREELLQFQEQLPNAVPDAKVLAQSDRRLLSSSHSIRFSPARAATCDAYAQTDPLTFDNLPSQFAARDAIDELPRPGTTHGRRVSDMHGRRRVSEMRNRRASRWRSKKASIHPETDALELDAPKRLQARDNVRRALGRWHLFWYDLRRWWHLKRTRRRDPIPIWSRSIKRIEGYFGSGLASFFTFLRWLFLVNLLISVVYICLVILPMAIRFDYNGITESFQWYNVIDGAGAVGQSWIFYGGYSSIGGYRMDLAYVLVPAGLITACFFIIIRSAAKTSESKSLVQIDARMPFGIIVLASWDYSLNQPSGVENLKSGISNAIKDAIAEDKAQHDIHELKEADWKEKARVYAMRAAAWFIWMLFVAGSFAAIWFVVLEQRFTSVGNNFVETYAPVLVLSFINGALPLAIKRLNNIEHYKHPRTASQVTTLRVFMLRILTIYALLYGFFQKTNFTELQTPVYNGTNSSASITQDDCAGTVIGKEIYKLVLVDTLVGMLQRLAATLFWYFWLKRRVELDLVQCVLHLVYRQGLVWIGMSFSPAVPVVAAISNVRRFCRPPQTRWDSSKNTSFFLWCLGATLFFMAIPLAWALTEYKPNCGPYAASEYDSWFDAISMWITESKGSLRRFFSVVLNPVFMFGVLLLLCMWITMLRIRVQNVRRVVRDTEWELKQTREDKKMLLVALQVKGGRGNALGAPSGESLV